MQDRAWTYALAALEGHSGDDFKWVRGTELGQDIAGKPLPRDREQLDAIRQYERLPPAARA
jgi:hypothetical protein